MERHFVHPLINFNLFPLPPKSFFISFPIGFRCTTCSFTGTVQDSVNGPKSSVLRHRFRVTVPKKIDLCSTQSLAAKCAAKKRILLLDKSYMMVFKIHDKYLVGTSLIAIIMSVVHGLNCQYHLCQFLTVRQILLPFRPSALWKFEKCASKTWFFVLHQRILTLPTGINIYNTNKSDQSVLICTCRKIRAFIAGHFRCQHRWPTDYQGVKTCFTTQKQLLLIWVS